MNIDQEPIDIKTFRCPDSACGSRPFKRMSQLVAHLRAVHDRESRRSKVRGGNIQKGTAPAQEQRFDFSTSNGLNPVSPMTEDKYVLQGGQKLRGKPLRMTSSQKPLTNPETMDSDDWNFEFGGRSSFHPNFFDSVDGLGSSIYTGHNGIFENMHAGCFGEPYTLLPHGNPLDLGAGDQRGFYPGSQIPDEGTEMNGLPIESDDQTKRKMITAIQEKRAELKRIDEQIRMLEELKANRSNISEDISGLEGKYFDLELGIPPGL